MKQSQGRTVPTPTPAASPPGLVLGLRANWQQFTLLAVVNAFVGAMVGLERAVLPLLAEEEFGVASRSAVLSFLVSFGLVKALANLAAGRLADRCGRRGVLLAGWLAGLPVPFLIILAPSWPWVVFANALLGVNQGLCWSTAVIMKIDLVGPARRGLALGINEFAGYAAVSLAALASAYVASTYALRPYPFLLGAVFALAGLMLSLFFVRETRQYASHEAVLTSGPVTKILRRVSFVEVLLQTSWKNKTLFAVCQAGMVNNLNDGVAWGLFPLFFAAAGLSLERIGVLAALYPGVWGVCQLATGAVSDRVGRKWLIAAGMATQAAAHFFLLATTGFLPWAAAMALLGLGTALVYPTLLAAVTDVAQPEWRASAVGVYRLWRDGGYAVGAVLSGFLADLAGIPAAVAAVGGLTLLSGLVVAVVMRETLPERLAGAPVT